MTELDKVKTDAETALAGVKAEISKLEVIEGETTTFIKIHLVVIIGVLSFIVGTIVGHFV